MRTVRSLHPLPHHTLVCFLQHNYIVTLALFPPTETGLTSVDWRGRILIPETRQAYTLACVIFREGRFRPSLILFISRILYPDQFICSVRDLWCDISLVSIKLSEDATLISVICNPEDLSTKLWQTTLKFSALQNTLKWDRLMKLLIDQDRKLYSQRYCFVCLARTLFFKSKEKKQKFSQIKKLNLQLPNFQTTKQSCLLLKNFHLITSKLKLTPWISTLSF